MKEDMMRQAIGDIDDRLIAGAEKQPTTRRPGISWVKWGSIAAAFKLAAIAAVACLVIVCVFAIVPNLRKSDLFNGNGPATDNTAAPKTDDETGDGLFSWTEHYENVLVDDSYCHYKMGKHIESDMISGKICNSKVQGGMVTPNGWSPEYEFDAEILSISGVSPEVAVAVKSKTLTYEIKDDGKIVEQFFKDDLYVMYNPESDLTTIKDYIVTFIDPNPFRY